MQLAMSSRSLIEPCRSTKARGSRGLTAGSILLFALFLTSCRGDRTPKPPVLPIQNMVDQTSYGPQAPNQFFNDKRAMRSSLANTVAQNEAQTDIRYNKGQESNSTDKNPVWVKNFPIKLDKKILLEGQKNFNIYCAPCHGFSGHNDGLAVVRSVGSIRPANIHDPDIIARPVGKIYDAVTNGVNNWNMPGFSAQLDTDERWGVVAYVRALQVSEQGGLPPHGSTTKSKEPDSTAKPGHDKKGAVK